MRGAAIGLRVLLVAAVATDARRVVPSLLDESADARGGMPNRSTIDASALAALGETLSGGGGGGDVPPTTAAVAGEEDLEDLEGHRNLSSAEEDDRLVKNLPGLDSSAYPHRHWAGYVNVDRSNGGHLFYWLFEAWNKPDLAPLVVWINGGPGCSSSDGLFLENGPFKVDNDQKLTVHKESWAAAANLLYIDQPVGTGLSFTTGRVYPKNDNEVNRALLEFFDGFFKAHPHLAARTMFLSGESHAGHYLPSLARAMLLRNDQVLGQAASGGAAGAGGAVTAAAAAADGAAGAAADQPRERRERRGLGGGSSSSSSAGSWGYSPQVFKLGGVAIGNGWFDPHHQYDVSEFAHGNGLISSGQVATLKKKEKECRKALASGRYMTGVCWDLLDDVVKASGAQSKLKVLMYDIRQYTRSTSVFPPHHERVERFLNNKAVRAALHVTKCPLVFKECTDPPYNALKHQDGLGVTTEVAFLLERKLKMLFFNGQYDMICNHMGVEKALDALQWSGRNSFNVAAPAVWLDHGKSRPLGYARSSGPLTLLLVMGSGHMVPLDKPAESLDMLRRFIDGKNFADADTKAIRGSPLPNAGGDPRDRVLRQGHHREGAEEEEQGEAGEEGAESGRQLKSGGGDATTAALPALLLSFCAGAAVAAVLTRKRRHSTDA